MPALMPPRLRFLLLTLLCAWTGAAIGPRDVATARPWTTPAFVRAAFEVAFLWSAAGLALGAVVLLFARRRALGGAWLVPPLAWGIAWLLVELDPRGQVATLELA